MDAAAGELLERVRSYALPKRIEGASGSWLRQRGRLRLGTNRSWLSFTAEQTIDAVELGFRWVARVRMSALLHITVTDAFEAGHGHFGVEALRFPIQKAASGPQLDAGELLRLLLELPWCPPLYEHPALTWSSPDEHSLRVELEHDGARLPVDMEVDDRGQVVRARAGQRPRLVGKTYIPTPWTGAFWEYRDYGDVRMPAGGEATWQLPEGPYTWWQGEIVEAGLLRGEKATT